MNRNGLTKLREIGTDAIIGAYQAYFGRCFSAKVTSEMIEFFDCDYFIDEQFANTHWTVRCYVDTDWKLKVSYNDRIFTEAEEIEHLRGFANAAQGYIDNYLKREETQKAAQVTQKTQTQEEEQGR